MLLFKSINNTYKMCDNPRNHTINVLESIFKKQNNEKSYMIKNLEKSILNHTIEYAISHGVSQNWDNQIFKNMYVQKSLGVISNIDKDSYIDNDSLFNRLTESKEFRPQDVPYLKPDKTFPKIWKDIVESKSKKDQYAYEVQYVPNASEIKCGKCKKNKVYFYEIQTRSADEPTSLICTCLNCGNRWRMN